MSKAMRVDPVELRMASDHVLNAAAEYAQSTARHLDDFADAVNRWRGDVSKTALQETADRWESHYAAHHRRVCTVGYGLAEAGRQFETVDEIGCDAINHVEAGSSGSLGL